MIVLLKHGVWVAHELIAVQVGDEGWVKPIRIDVSAKRRKLLRQGFQQVPKRLGLDFNFRNSGKTAWNG